LIEKPNTHSTAKLASRQSGTVTAGISVARQLPRNRKMTSTTSTAASASVTQTPSMARLMNCDSSDPTTISIPCGSVGLISSAACLAASATASVLAPDWRTMPRPIAGWPLSRKAV
jgi:hypothetical protein